MLKKAVSFSSNHSSPPDITVEGDGNEHDPSDGLIERKRIGDPSARRTLTIVSEDLTGATSFSNCDEVRCTIIFYASCVYMMNQNTCTVQYSIDTVIYTPVSRVDPLLTSVHLPD